MKPDRRFELTLKTATATSPQYIKGEFSSVTSVAGTYLVTLCETGAQFFYSTENSERAWVAQWKAP